MVGLACVQAGLDSINKDVVVKSYDRTLDMTTQLVKLQHKMVIENQGSENTYIQVSETKFQSYLDRPFWKIEIKSSLSAGASITISMEVVLGWSPGYVPRSNLTEGEVVGEVHGQPVHLPALQHHHPYHHGAAGLLQPGALHQDHTDSL